MKYAYSKSIVSSSYLKTTTESTFSQTQEITWKVSGEFELNFRVFLVIWLLRKGHILCFIQMGRVARKLAFSHVRPATTDQPAHPRSLIRAFTDP